jgi:hypothetical protein
MLLEDYLEEEDREKHLLNLKEEMHKLTDLKIQLTLKLKLKRTLV